MKILKSLIIISLVGFIAAGCRSKSIKVSFFNNTESPINVDIEGPGSGTGELGTVMPQRVIRTKIKVRKKYLPDQYIWHAGDSYNGKFLITKHSPKEIFINIGPRREIRADD